MSDNSYATSAERRLAARIGAEISWANTPNRSRRTAPARAALEAKFLEQAGGDPVRAEHLRKAHFARLSLKSAQSRRKAQESLLAAYAADAEITDLGGVASCEVNLRTSPPTAQDGAA